MGFQRGRVTVKWPEGHELYGFEIVMRRRPFGEVLDEWEHETEQRDGAALTGAERAARSRAAAVSLVNLILSWNLEDDDTGKPVPVSVDGLLGVCDIDMIYAIRAAYESSLAVAPPLPTSSVPSSSTPSSGMNGNGAATGPALPTMPEDWGPVTQEPLISHPA